MTKVYKYTKRLADLPMYVRTSFLSHTTVKAVNKISITQNIYQGRLKGMYGEPGSFLCGGI